MIEYRVGLDLSLTSPGFCAIPKGWGCDMGACVVMSRKFEGPRLLDCDRAKRLIDVAHTLFGWILALTGEREVAIESLPTRSFSTIDLAELHGVIRYQLYSGGWRTRTAPQSTARKLFLGKLPQKDRKIITCETVRSFDGCNKWNDDECDAFVVANWLCAELREPFISAPKG